jgi:pimeloyl-ACP methyl ester carboxylesterase
MKSLLILHGALGSASQLDPVKEKFKQHGYEVHSVNFSGHGGEPFQAQFGIEQFTVDVLRYLDNHQIKLTDIFGYSMGGYVALWLAKDHPERVNRIVTLGTKFDWSVESSEKEVKKLNPEKILEKVPAFARILEHRHAPNDWKTLLQRTGEMMLSLGKNPILTRELLQTIKHPVIVCLGDLDDMADRNYSEKVAGFLPKGTFQLFENTPHPIEKMDLKKLVEAFE